MKIPDREEQCRQVRAWCEANGVCAPAEGWEWVWWLRLFGLSLFLESEEAPK